MPSSEGSGTGSSSGGAGAAAGAAAVPWRVLIVGGSYAGLAAATNLLDLSEGRLPRFNPALERDNTLTYKANIEITIVDERDGYYHLIGSPLAFASEDYAAKAWVKFTDVAALQHKAVTFVQGSVQTVDCENMTATITEHASSKQRTQSYDYLIAASGQRRPWPVVPQALTRTDYLAEAQGNIDAAKNAQDGVVIIGGGAVGVEMAAELKLIHPSTKVTLIHSRSQLLSAEPLPDEFKDAIAPLVRDAGVELVLGQRVKDVSPSTTSSSQSQTITLTDGTTLKASHVMRATSNPVPVTNYLPPSSLDAEGFVRITPTLHFMSDGTPNSRRHFAAGDLAAWSGIKRCGAAMHMGHLAAFNIHQQIILDNSSISSSPSKSSSSSPSSSKKPEYMKLSDHPPMIGLAVGHQAISYGPTEGVKHGVDQMKLMFGDDLGWSICWGYMRLGEENPVQQVEEKKEDEVILGLETLDLADAGGNEVEKTLDKVVGTATAPVVAASA